MRAFGAHLIEYGADFEESARRSQPARRDREGWSSLLPSRLTWSRALRPTRWNCCVPRRRSTRCMYRSVSARASAARFARATYSGSTTEIIGVQSAGADPYARSLTAGHLVAINRAETNADGMAVRQPDAEAFAIIRAGASRIVTVSDTEIAAAMRAYWTDTHNLTEGAGAARSPRCCRSGTHGGASASAWSSAAAISILTGFADGSDRMPSPQIKAMVTAKNWGRRQ